MKRPESKNLPKALHPEKIKCNICGKWFNPANLYSVFLHEHNGSGKVLSKNYIGRRIK